MYVRPLIVFKTPFYEPRYKQFRNPSELQKFLTVFDFMRPHMCSRLQTGMPEFQLGTKLEFTIDGYFCESDVKWGPRFIVARAVTNNQGRIFADIPTDAPGGGGDSMLVTREYKLVQIHRDMADAVIDIHNMRQLWPVCEESRSEFVKFLTYLNRQKYQIKRR